MESANFLLVAKRNCAQPSALGNRTELTCSGSRQSPTPKDNFVRFLRLMMLGVGTIFVLGPATAQTYNPDFPVCLQVSAPRGGYIECAYTSLAQCNLSASGRAAQCYVTPFFLYASGGPPGRAHR